MGVNTSKEFSTRSCRTSVSLCGLGEWGGQSERVSEWKNERNAA